MLRYQKNPLGKRKTGEIEVDGKLYKAKYIGKGQFSKVYRVGDRVIYYTRGDCGKEVLAMFQYDRMMHLPEMIRHENITIRPGIIWYVFSSPYYRNVKRTDTSAYRMMKIIIEMYKEFWNQQRDYQYQAYGRVKQGIGVMQKFVEYVNEMKIVSRSVVKALQEIVNVASNCGPIVGFDLHSKNFGVNEYGTLIFRDPFYVMEL